MRLILEQRYLFDGSVAQTAQAAHRPEHHADSPAQPPRAEPAPDATRPAPAATPAPATAPAPRELLFVDPRVANWKTLADGARPGTSVVVLDTARDGLTQITEALASRTGIEAVHVLSYGKAGEADFGSSAVTASTLLDHAADLATWRDHLAPAAQVDFWGCDVGAGDAGDAFVARLHALTGAGIAASTDATGSTGLHGDWTLERSVDVDHVRTPFSAEAIEAYGALLDQPLPTVIFSDTPGSILLGSTFSETVTFQNTAASAVGYGPFIDLFARNTAAERAPLTSATYGGASLTFQGVTLSTGVAGHAGTLGALHPFALDATGAPLFVEAPAGFVAGDALYAIKLPFGSYSPGQPGASVTLNFALAPTSELTAVHPGTQVNIAAVGGFQFGTDPLNNPVTDPSLRGTSILEGPSASDAGNGLVTAASDVTLLSFAATVTTSPGEGESPTGASFPGAYVVTLTPAPATTGDPIGNLSVNVALPDGVRYTGGTIAVAGSTGTASFTPSPNGADGGTVTVTFPSIAASAAATTIDIPVYAARDRNAGTPLIDPATGTPVTIAAPSVTYGGGTWTPRAGSLDAGTIVPVSGAAPLGSPTFVAKALAVQETATDLTTGTAAIRPGDALRYTIAFEVSDGSGIDALVLQSLLGDGLTLDPSVAPVLTVTAGGVTRTVSFGTIAEPAKPVVNGQTVATTGNSAFWSYSRDNAGTGATALSFNAGSALAASSGSSIIAGTAAKGTLTFTARVLDRYTTTHVDPVTSTPGTIGEGDTVSSTATGRAALLNAAGQPTGAQVSDSSGVTLAEAPGGLALRIVAINGVASNGTTIQPGDSVTYRTTYTLTSGDFVDLKLSDYLPLPVFNVADPAADGSNRAFVQALAGAFPTVGGYRLVQAPNGVGLQAVTVDGTGNDIVFSLGGRDDPSNAAGQRIVIDFTVKASTIPFADGLLLTTQALSAYRNAAETTATATTTAAVLLQEPNLTLKAGVVSLVDDSGIAKAGVFRNEVTSAPGDPATVFRAAGTTGTPFTGAIPATTGVLQNLNLSGADGGDTARIAVTVENTGNAQVGAFDVTLAGTLPTGLTLAGLTNFRITRGDGTVLTFTRPDGTPATIADFFSATGIKLNGDSGDASTPSLFRKGDAQNRDILFVTYDVRLPNGEPAGQTLTGNASVLNFASFAGGVAAGRGFVAGGIPVGGTAASITDKETVGTAIPALAKTVAASNVPEDDNADPVNYPNRTVVAGETRPVTITLTLPEGSITNGTSDVRITETLPIYETFGGLVSLVAGPGVTLNGTPSTVATVSGNVVTFDLGSSVVNSNIDGSGTVSITYNALFPANGGNNLVLTSTAALVYDGAAVTPAILRLIEHEPIVKEVITDDSGPVIFSNQVITYTVTLSNSGLVDAKALVAGLVLSSNLTYLPGTLTAVSGGSGATTDAANAADLKIGLDALTPNGVSVFTFQARVSPNQVAGTALRVASAGNESTYHTVPTVLGAGKTFQLAATDVDTFGNFASTLTIVGEANGTAVTPPSEAAPATAVNVTIGDLVELRAVVNQPEGANNAVTLDFAIPAGLIYAPGSLRLAFVSPGGHTMSSVLDPAGTNAALQVTDPGGGTGAIPTFVVPGTAISTAAGHLYVSLGRLVNNDGSPIMHSIIAEFTAVVGNVIGNQDGTTLSQALTVNRVASNAVSETVKEPVVGITKAVTGVDTATGTVTYRVTLTNTGSATAYAVTLNDPESANENPIANLATTGTGTNLSVTSGTGTFLLAATLDLAAGASQTFTYDVRLINALLPVPGVTTTETYRDLRTATVTLAGSTSGPQGSATGGRDGITAPLTLNDYRGSVANGLGAASGRVYQVLGTTNAPYDPARDTALGGVLVTARTAGQDGSFGTADDLVQTTTTAADGTYAFGLLPDGTFRITLPPSGANGLPAGETLVYDPFGNVATLPATGAGLTAGTAQPGVDFAFRAGDTAPLIGNLSNGTRAIDPGTPVALSSTGAATVADAELDRLVAANEGYSYTGAVLTVQRYVGGAAAPSPQDSFGGDGTLVLTGGQAVLGGTTVGTYVQSGGVLAITFNANAAAPQVAAVLDHLTYANAGSPGIQLGLTIGATLSDGNTAGEQGTGGVLTSAPAFATFNVRAAVPANVTFIEPNDAPASAAAVAIAPTIVLSGNSPIVFVFVTITGNYAGAEDQLVFTPNAETGRITGSFAGNSLLLAGDIGSTAAQFQAALRAVRYFDASDRPATATRTLGIIARDIAGRSSMVGTVTLAVVPANDSPILDLSAARALAAAAEDAGAPSGAVGTAVAGLVAGVTDPDGAGVANGAAAGLGGIAVTGVDTAHGSWWFSTDGGANWTRFAGPGIATPVSDANALHLVADAATRIYFQPLADFNGIIPLALQLRAWDQFDSQPNGTLAALPGDSALGSGSNTLASSYSAAVATLPLSVAAVNDAPLASGSATLAPVTEDPAAAPGALVATLFGSNFFDTADQQQSAANPAGSTANTLAGAAVTGNTTPESQGAWRYSTDGGATWTALPTGLSDTNAVLLPANVRLDFLPAANFNGAPPPLTVRLIDSSASVATVVTGADVSAHGGTTAISDATVALNTNVTAVNDAPIASGTATLSPVTEDATLAPGATVGALFAANFSDAADQQASAANPAGSTADTLAGVAVTGNDTPASQGVWRYSTDGGATWTALPTGLSDINAVLLPTAARLDFLPATNFNGVPPPLTVRLIDSSATIPAVVTGADVSVHGGTTAISDATVALNTSVTAANDAPIASGGAALSPVAEDATAAPGATVAALFATTFSDAADQQASTVNPAGSTANTLAGVAVTGNITPASQGAWRYSIDGGVTWTALPTGLSDTNAIVLPAAARLDFLPTVDFNGVPPPLTVRLIDSSTSVPTVVTGADVSVHGGTTAISDATVALNTSVTAVNDAPVASGTATLAPVTEDSAIAPGETVAALFAANFSDAADQQASTANPAGSAANTLAGVAVTGNTTPASQGVWRYSTDGGVTWTALPTGLSDANALLLPAVTRLDFLPAADFNGSPPALLVRLIDSSTSVPSVVTSADVSVHGGTTAISDATVALATSVAAVNDAPIASGTATLAPVAEDPATAPGATVATLFAANFADTADQQASTANPGGSTANTLAGVAITGNTTPASEGVWRYSTDGGVTWTALPTGLSDASAILLPATARLDFLPAANFNGVPPALTVRLIDSSATIPAVVTGADVSAHGGTTAISDATIALNTSVTAVNDAPIASGTVTLPSAAPQGMVGMLFGPALSDAADAQRNALNPAGSVADTLAGIALVANPTPASQGVWRYSVDGGATFTEVPATLSDSNALLLPGTAILQFVAAPGFTGSPAPLLARLVETSSDLLLTGTLTGAGLATAGTAFPGVDVSGPNQGGATSVSAATVPVTVTVTATNHAPVASGPAALPGGAEDTTAPPDQTVGALFAANYSDTADGADAHALAGVAVVGNATPASEGAWRYSLDGGTTWTVIPTGLSDANALLLSAGVRLDFLPAADFNGAPPALTVRLIEASPNVRVGGIDPAAFAAAPQAVSGVSVAAHGGTAAVSDGTVALSTTVSPANDAPVGAGSAVLPAVAENATAAPGATVAALFAGTLSDTADAQRNALNPTGSVADGFAGIAITGNAATAAQGVWRYSLDGGTTWTVLPPVSEGSALLLSGSARLDFLPAINFAGLPGGLTARVIDRSSDVPLAAGLTGAGLAATTRAATADVSGSHAGGRTAVSLGSVPLDTLVTPTDASPLAGGPAHLADITNGDPTPGATVYDLYIDRFSSPRGDPLTGIVLVGDLAPAFQGVWRYSVDGGRTFTDVPAGLSATNGLLLPVGAVLTFVPAADFSGTPGGLVAYLVGGTSTFIAPGLRGSDVAGLTTPRQVDLTSLIGNPTAPITARTVTLDTGIRPRALAAAPPLGDVGGGTLTTTPGGAPVIVPPGLTPASFPSGTPYLTSNPATDRNRDVVTSDWFARPYLDLSPRPDARYAARDWLEGTTLYRYVLTEQPAVVEVSRNAFRHSSPDQRLQYTGQQAGGQPLPVWLSFDPRALTFYGTPPASAAGTLELEVVARDEQGNVAVTTVRLRVGRSAADLLTLLQVAEPRQGRPPSTVRGAPARPAERLPAQAGRSAFTTQLRGFDATARARALLDALGH